MFATDINVVAPEFDYSWFIDRLLDFFDGFGDVAYALLTLFDNMPSFWSTFMYIVFIFTFVSVLIKVMLK